MDLTPVQKAFVWIPWYYHTGRLIGARDERAKARQILGEGPYDILTRTARELTKEYDHA